MASPQQQSEPRVNERIRAAEVRLIDEDGTQLGVKSSSDALHIARGKDLDLVEVAPGAKPPVCRIMDYGKFKFENAQKAREARKKTHNVVLKEMKYRLKIGPGDFETKTRKVEKFLKDGHKVKITVMFRGREMERPQFGRNLLKKIADEVESVAKIEFEPKMDNRNMIMVLAPGKKPSSNRNHEPKPESPGVIGIQDGEK